MEAQAEQTRRKHYDIVGSLPLELLLQIVRSLDTKDAF